LKVARRLALSNKKLRGVPRRLRAIDRWAEGFNGYFPDLSPLLEKGERYYNWKIPVHASLVQGKQATLEQKAACAQAMIKACSYLMAAKPPRWKAVRVTADIQLPHMFWSELCLYLDEAYFESHVRSAPAAGKLSARWSLSLPPGIHERGIAYELADDNGRTQPVEQWFFGETGPTF
jgi:hypothetical protein